MENLNFKAEKMNNLIIKTITERYEKKIGYKMEIWELKYLYCCGELILLNDSEENAIIDIIHN